MAWKPDRLLKAIPIWTMVSLIIVLESDQS